MKTIAPTANTILSALVLSLCLAGCNRMSAIERYQHGQENVDPAEMIWEISQANIIGNTPSKTDFHGFMVRDLTEYFRQKYKHCRITYEMLQDEPTQAGVGYPHYYVWVKVYQQNSLVTQGAARLSAMNGTSFYLTDFASHIQIRTNPRVSTDPFPSCLLETIMEKAARPGYK